MLYDIFSNKADDLRLGEFLPEEFELSFGVDYFFFQIIYNDIGNIVFKKKGYRVVQHLVGRCDCFFQALQAFLFVLLPIDIVTMSDAF